MAMTTMFASASEATATWRFTNFVLYCIVKQTLQVIGQHVNTLYNHISNKTICETSSWMLCTVVYMNVNLLT